MATLFASLPSIPPPPSATPHAVPAAAPAIQHATPVAFMAKLNKLMSYQPYRTRYGSRGNLLTHARSSFVLHHTFLPARQLDSMTAAGYLALLQQNALFKNRSPYKIIELLLPLGFGVHKHHGQVYATLSPNPKKVRDILYSFNRPVFLVGTVTRDARQDLWDALVASAPGSIEIPAEAVLGLLLSVECVGLEEPTADSQVPREQDRMHCVRERVAIVVVRQVPRTAIYERDMQDEDSSYEIDQGNEHEQASGEDDDSSPEERDSDVGDMSTLRPPNASQPKSSTEAPDQLAFPPFIASASAKLGIKLRYSSGRLQVQSNETVLAHELVPARDIPTELRVQYIAKAQPYFKESSLPFHIFAYAMRRGHSNPFSHAEVKRALADSGMERRYHDTTFYGALRNTVARPLFVVDELDVEEHQHVYRRLVEAAEGESGAGRVSDEARLVMLLGLEIVGLELPREVDQVPAVADRMYVVRERYALIQ
ncbi:hypothetical protein BCR44DRAFT_39909 [Catenaria anguillulae PL171]|uniref:Uncharacterized protein n=1 Tax=Catenaria anguillulae PL171 TaxID=765915 RepID=A0A1Y2HD79_9FUNG|nr:hypothetical protein BCR44DRAFT_39909 [Catenaria anguillulae PL171]